MKVFLFAIFLTSFKLLSSEWEPISKERAAELVIKKSENFLDYKNGDVIKFRSTTDFGDGCISNYESSDTILLNYKVFRKSYVWAKSKWGYSDESSNARYCEEKYENGKGSGSHKSLYLVEHRNLEVDFFKELLDGKLGDEYEYNSELNKIRFFFPLTKELGIKSIFNLNGNNQTFYERMVSINNTTEGKALITSQAWTEKADIKKLYSELNDEKVYMELYYLKGLEPKTFPLSKNYGFEIPNETFGKILSGNSKGK